MSNSISARGLTLDQLQTHSTQNKGFLKGRIDGAGNLEIYASEHGTGKLEKEIAPLRPWERQQLAAIALYDAVEKSYGHQVADKVMNSLRKDLLDPNSYMTGDLIDRAKNLAEKAAKGGKLPGPGPVHQPPPAMPTSVQQAIPKKSAEDDKNSIGLPVAPKPQVNPNDNDEDDDDVVKDIFHPDHPERNPTPGGPKADFDHPVDKPAPPPQKDPDVHAAEDAEKPQRAQSKSLDDAPKDADLKDAGGAPAKAQPNVARFELANSPTPVIRKKLNVVARDSDASIASRQQRRKGAPRERGMALGDITTNLRKRDINNQEQGRLFLKRTRFGELLKDARDAKVVDRLGSRRGFPMDSGVLNSQVVTKAGAEKAILKAFRDCGDYVAGFDEVKKREIAVAALKDYLALPPDPPGV